MSRTDKDRPYLVRVYDLTDKKKQSRSVHHFHIRAAWSDDVDEDGYRYRVYVEHPCDLDDYSVKERLYRRHDKRGGPWCTMWLDQGQGAWRRNSDSYKRIGRRVKRRVTNQWCHEARYDPELDGPPQFPLMTGMKWWDW